MDIKADKLFLQVPKILWSQALAQAQALKVALPAPKESLLASVNEWRATQHWPLCTGMLPVTLPLCHAAAIVPPDTRALWQMGLLQQLKGIETGVSVMRRALAPLCAQSETWLGQIAILLDHILLNETFLLYPEACTHCFASFDRLLKHPIDNAAAMLLWVEVNFYVAEHLEVNDAGKEALRIRIKPVAEKMAEMLLVKENTDTVSKKLLFPLYLSLTDGLLFLEEGKLVNFLEKLYTPLPTQLLNISVPVQKLWAQCTSISVHCP